MRIQKQILKISGLSLCVVMMIGACSAQTPQKSIHSPDGWVVKYGVVNGATTQPDAIVSELRLVAKSFGESPSVSKPFRYKGTTTVGVFYGVRNHTAANVPMTGLILSDFNDKKQVETAVMYDTASRFPRTLQPMMQTVFKEWRPGGAAAASGSPGRSSATPASGSQAAKGSGPVPSLHTVVARDNSATIGLPDGWTLDPRSGSSAMMARGPHGEQININMSKFAIDPSMGSNGMILQRMGPQRGTLYYPFRGDLVKSFPDMFQAWRRANGEPPVRLQVDEIKPMPAQPNDHCAAAQGHVDLGAGMQALTANMCAFNPTAQSMGDYLVRLSFITVPNALADEEKTTTQAIVQSYKVNQQVMNQQTAAGIAAVNANTRMLEKETQIQIDHIHEIGRQADARYAEADRQRVESSQRFDQQEENISRYGQGFSNYILDQNVIEYSDYNGNVYHETVPNNIAYSLAKHLPDKVEIVDTPNYIPEIDFRK